jgi:hypothetical protein
MRGATLVNGPVKPIAFHAARGRSYFSVAQRPRARDYPIGRAFPYGFGPPNSITMLRQSGFIVDDFKPARLPGF